MQTIFTLCMFAGGQQKLPAGVLASPTLLLPRRTTLAASAGVRKWPLVPPHHYGTHIAAQGPHQTWRTAVVRGQEKKPGQMMIHIHHIHHISPPPQVLIFLLPLAQAVTPETNTSYIYSIL